MIVPIIKIAIRKYLQTQIIFAGSQDQYTVFVLGLHIFFYLYFSSILRMSILRLNFIVSILFRSSPHLPAFDSPRIRLYKISLQKSISFAKLQIKNARRRFLFAFQFIILIVFRKSFRACALVISESGFSL